ncbi:MAG TPA: O-antigen ligase family protein [Gaiellaceae bacterium]|nr:O-antigen ligase family protein [Gaiellaceae bacterium]
MTRSERFAGLALVLLVVGLALHNVVMAQLWELGVRGTALDAFAAWKETLLLVALLVVGWNVRRLPSVIAADVLAAAYATVIVVYVFLPGDWLGGEATARGELLALRHHLLPVAAYALGRFVTTAWDGRRSLGGAIALTAGGVAIVGLLDLGLVSLQSWRESGVPGWYREQLGLEYEGLSGLPENWIYNTGDEENPIRRLVSTLLSPLATAYLFVVALIFAVSRPFRWWWGLLALLLYAGLLYTHTRAALGVLAVALVVLALVQRRITPAALAVASIAVGGAFLLAYPSLGPSTSYTQEELEWLRENAEREPDETSGDPFAGSDSSTRSHWRNLRDGVEAVIDHPRGYGLGNAGVVAKRTGVEIRAGESTYTELGVDAGVAGLAVFVLWSLALLRGLWRREAWLAAAFAAVLLLGLQTDVIGVHWLAFSVWAAAGLVVAPGGRGAAGSVDGEEPAPS